MNGSDSSSDSGRESGSKHRQAEIEAAGAELSRLWAEAKGAQTQTVRDAMAAVGTDPDEQNPGLLAVCYRSSPSWLLSALFHFALLVALYALSLSAAEEHDGLVLTALIDRQEDIELEEVEFEDRLSPIVLEQSQPLPSVLQDPGAGDFDPPLLADGLDGQLGAMETAWPPPARAGGGATFFGLKAEGNKFAFVVDGSVSMHRRWEACRRELLAAVSRLEPHHLFYVILFNSRSHPMFSDDDPQPDPLPATAENVARLRQWLDNFQLRSGTRPLEGMKSALQMRPDAIYFLTDGELHDDTEDYLKANNERRDVSDNAAPAAAVHAIGFHADKGGDVLRRIAEDNGGNYRSVGGPQDPGTDDENTKDLK